MGRNAYVRSCPSEVIRFSSFFWDRVSQWLGACPVDYPDWPRKLLPSAFPMLRFKAYIITSCLLMCFWKLNSESHACTAWAVLTELSPSPHCDYLFYSFTHSFIHSRLNPGTCMWWAQILSLSCTQLTNSWLWNQFGPSVEGILRWQVFKDFLFLLLVMPFFEAWRNGKVLLQSTHEGKSIVPALKRPKI